MLAGRHDFVIEQGQDWIRYLHWQDSDGDGYDLSDAGWNATFKVRYYRGDTGDAIMSLTEEAGVTLSDGSGEATYNIKLEASDTVTAALDFSRGIYTLELEDVTGIVGAAGEKFRLLEGSIMLSKETTN